jgi:SAM-dependent methyltransferase
MPLVIGYADDWDKVFEQVNNRLKKEGYFIFSHGNPVFESTERIKKKGRFRVFGDYFTERKIFSKWKNIFNKGKVKDITLHSYHKTYETIIRTIVRNNFEIVDYRDCFPTKESKKLFPEEYKFLSKIPYFCVWKVRKK